MYVELYKVNVGQCDIFMNCILCSSDLGCSYPKSDLDSKFGFQLDEMLKTGKGGLPSQQVSHFTAVVHLGVGKSPFY